MCAIMTDVVQGNIQPELANAACNAGRGLLRMVELEYKFSTAPKRNGNGGIVVSRRLVPAKA